MKIKPILAAFGLAAVIALASVFAFKYGYARGQHAPIIPQRDTIIQTDTICIDRPVEVVRYIDRERPVYIAVHDTTTINDTAFVVLPREVVEYGDSTYRAQVSGVQPSLDWIEVYQRTEVINNYVETLVRPRSALVLYGGAAAGDGRETFTARAGLEYQHRVTGGFEYYLQTGYDVRTRWYLGAGVRLVLWQTKD